MARNEEKAQSMLYRFREVQAQEMGLVGRTDRRPRVASACKDLRQCEKWRGEILREISRKVSKIQDATLTDYEVRDLNDEINKLLREKNHWENQIIALGGANYKRSGVRSWDTEGQSAPNARGYKYFGRARELPGVKELFETAAAETAEQESYKTVQGAAAAFVDALMRPQDAATYLGNDDDADEELLAAERQAEEQGWQDHVEELRDELGVDDLADAPACPRAQMISLDDVDGEDGAAAEEEEEEEEEEQEEDETTRTGSKRKGKGKGKAAAASSNKKAKQSTAATAKKSASGPRFESVLRAADLRAPALPSVKELEQHFVHVQKQALLAEYGV